MAEQNWGFWSAAAIAMLMLTSKASAQYSRLETSFNASRSVVPVYKNAAPGLHVEVYPRIECDGLMDKPAAPQPTPAIALPSTIEASIAAFAAQDYPAAVRLLAPGARAHDVASEYALACVMEGLERAQLNGEHDPGYTDDPRAQAILDAIEASRRVWPSGIVPALAWLADSAEAGFEPAQRELAARVWDPRSRVWAEKSVKWVDYLAQKGRPEQERMLGQLYLMGQGHPTDWHEGARLLLDAARKGDSPAMVWLAGALRDGRAEGGAEAALPWLRRLADGGDANARYYYALALREGPASPDRLAEAAAQLDRASGQGLAAATFELSLWYRGGIGVRQDADKAAALLTQAALGGNCFAKLEVLELRMRTGEIAAMSAPAKKAVLDEYDKCGMPNVRIDRDADSKYGFALSQAEKAGWEVRRDSVREALGLAILDAAVLRAAFLSGDETAIRAALTTLETLATEDEGKGTFSEEALAILAYPAPWLPVEVRARFGSERWRAKITAADRVFQKRVMDQVLASALTDKNFPLVLAMADHTGTDSSVIDRFETLQSMGLGPLAFKELLAYLPQAKTSDVKQRLIDSGRACSWDLVTSERVAAVAGVNTECGGLPALRQLSAGQLQQLADLGSYEAVVFLGLDYLDGRTVKRDVARAIEILDASDAEDVGQAIVGALLDDGAGVAPDPVRAAQHFAPAFENYRRYLYEVWFPADPSAATRYGRMLYEGRGVEPNRPQGLALLRYGSFVGVGMAQTSFADALWLGGGIPTDHEEALRWYREALAGGDSSAPVRFGFLAALGLWNERGLGADRWYQIAAQTGDPIAYLDLARATAYAPDGGRALETVRRWLTLAAQKDNRWARQWLDACRTAMSTACFKAQPDFPRLFAPIAAAAPHHKPPRSFKNGDPHQAAAALATDVTALSRQIDFGLAHGDSPTDLDAALATLERVQGYHGAVSDAIGTRLRRLVLDDAGLVEEHGDLGNYFALVESSCHWGEASKMADANGRRDTALFFAKVAVNRLQAARAYLKDLQGDIRECFIEVHEDRYRWLADLLVQSGRLAEAETVLGMLKDFEYANYTGDAMRSGASRAFLAYTPQEAVAARAIDDATAALQRQTGSALQGEPRPDSARPEPAGSFRKEMAALVASVEALDGNPQRAAWLGSVQRSIVSDIRRRFGPRTAALHAVVLPGRVQWILSTTEGQKSLTIAVREGDLYARIGDLLAAIQTISPDAETKAHALYVLIFAPVDAELKKLHIDTLLLSLDGRLRYLPFAALHDGTGWLVERYSFSSFRQPSDYLRSGQRGAWTIAGFGSTVARPGLAPLPSVADELNSIIRTSEAGDTGVVPGVIELNAAFTRETLADALVRDYRVIHIASHFVLDERQAQDSYLLLGDGTKLHLLDFSADGEFTFSHADLVTLSACKTALNGIQGDGSEIDSMAAVAEDAGAPAVLATLWSVADASTAKLMVAFYHHRVDEGLSTSAALRAAQLDLIRTPAPHNAGRGTAEFRHPFYWAPFILMGNSQ